MIIEARHGLHPLIKLHPYNARYALLEPHRSRTITANLLHHPTQTWHPISFANTCHSLGNTTGSVVRYACSMTLLVTMLFSYNSLSSFLVGRRLPTPESFVCLSSPSLYPGLDLRLFYCATNWVYVATNRYYRYF